MTDAIVHQRVAAARRGENPTAICRMRSGYLVPCDTQTPRGWRILLHDSVVPDLNALSAAGRCA